RRRLIAQSTRQPPTPSTPPPSRSSAARNVARATTCAESTSARRCTSPTRRIQPNRPKLNRPSTFAVDRPGGPEQPSETRTARKQAPVRDYASRGKGRDQIPVWRRGTTTSGRHGGVAQVVSDPGRRLVSAVPLWNDATVSDSANAGERARECALLVHGRVADALAYLSELTHQKPSSGAAHVAAIRVRRRAAGTHDRAADLHEAAADLQESHAAEMHEVGDTARARKAEGRADRERELASKERLSAVRERERSSRRDSRLQQTEASA